MDTYYINDHFGRFILFFYRGPRLLITFAMCVFLGSALFIFFVPCHSVDPNLFTYHYLLPSPVR